MKSRKLVLVNYLQGSRGDADIENRPVDMVRGGEGGTNCESSIKTHILQYANQMASGNLLSDVGSWSLLLCDKLEG